MDFELTNEQKAIQESVTRLCARFDRAYWLDIDTTGTFPSRFFEAMAADGWLGVCMPQEYGGAGLGITEAALVMRAVAQSGGGMTAASAIHVNIFGLNPVAVYGTPEQKQRMLPPIRDGKQKACFAVTEPNTGLNTTQLKTRAVDRGDHYLVNGQKVWISTAQIADKIMLLARTTRLEEVRKPSEGLSLFYTDLDRSAISIREMRKMGRKAIDSNELFITDWRIPKRDLIGEEGRGFEYILHGMNPERVLLAAEAVGLGSLAVHTAATYAKERIVFNRPIGQNQGIQHPLAQCWMELEAAWLMTMSAAHRYDQGLECGTAANAAKYLAAEAGFKSCETAVMTHGGFGYATDYHVERYLREVMIPRIAPISPQLILCYIAERVLGLPKSY
jgi:acyl-CoA dehydrogenase